LVEAFNPDQDLDEYWMPAPGYPGYEVSSLGRVQNSKTGRILKPSINAGGYVQFSLRGHSVWSHRLVAEAFVDNPDPKNLREVNHLDGDKSNNAALNLEWSNRAGNLRHAAENDLLLGSQAKLTADQVRGILRNACAGEKRDEIAHEFGVSTNTVNAICRGDRWPGIHAEFKGHLLIRGRPACAPERRVEPPAPVSSSGGGRGSSINRAGGIEPTAAWRSKPLSRDVLQIQYSDAWGMYRAQMADYGIEVEFGEPLTIEGAQLEDRLQKAWIIKHGELP
jgi:hypothetical protein